MPKTIAEHRRYDRERKRAERHAMRAAGIPPVSTLNGALVEAMAYALAKSDDPSQREGAPTLQLGDVVTAAAAILVDRYGFDRRHVRDRLKQVLRPRPEHRWPSYVPSLATRECAARHMD
ncbi:hypothetical protein GCM10007989_25490 [Devosia pacifica]|uniref:Uncharacterized protein n=1 Tax=Devosia pacifica TaxID=1335967 RepID=A0A918S7H7_9HYPH|nr:hypothetical protein [Devosia pacifica]GHA28337.1 hypothetical protein GCM10007989_25490 [Devosia pacifica]